MANRWHVDWLKEGVSRWNRRRKRVDFVPDLSGITFFEHLPKDYRDDPKTSRYFEKLNLSNANLQNADLSNLNFSRSDFKGADLTGANLSKSNFSFAKFIGSTLTDVNATRARFDGTIFEITDIRGMRLEEAEVTNAIFISTEISEKQRESIGTSSIQYFATRASFKSAISEDSGSIADHGKTTDEVDDRTAKVSYDVYYGTNRKPIFERGALVSFDHERNDKLSFGLCEVVVPDGHRIGKIGTRLFKKLLNRKDSSLRVESLIPLDMRLFWTHLLRTSEKMKDKARPTVFIHGFNNSFDDAVKRAAQIGHDLGIGQGIGLFSWPSRGGIFGITNYAADEVRAESSRYDLADFLESFVENGSDQGINVIAHSMGCRVLLGALEILSARQSAALQEIHQVILAAADVDAGIMPNLGKHAIQHSERLTSYVSGKDQALKLSGWLHSFPRVGKTPPTYVIEGMDTVVVNSLELGDFSHAYLASSRIILNDVYYILKNNLPPHERHSLEEVRSATSIHWRIKE